MRGKRILLVTGLVLALLAGLSLAQEPAPQESAASAALVGTAFTYQGRLTDGGSPAEGEYDFKFKLYDADADGNPLGAVTRDDVTLTNGLFTVQLDFGPGLFEGEARWLAIGVRPGAGSGSDPYTLLSPRQPLTPAPYALALPGVWTEQNSTSPNVIGGYGGNSVTAGVYGATVGGGGRSANPNRVTDTFGTVGGGSHNQAGDADGDVENAKYATVGGGLENTASGMNATIGGGTYNVAGGTNAAIAGGNGNQGGNYAFVGGGSLNAASGSMATIGGGGLNVADASSAAIGGGLYNQATAAYATIGGGAFNQAAAQYATIAGGGSDSATTSNGVTDDYGTVGGGYHNRAGNDNASTTDARYATVGGGTHNTAANAYATIGGGYSNSTSGVGGTVGGGFSHEVGFYGTVPGGYNSAATGNYSFAAGNGAQATHSGAFVWSSGASTASWGSNTFTARAHGGARFYSASGTSTGVQLSAGGTAWGSISDRKVKENFASVDHRRLLDTLAAMPLQTWNLKAQSPAMRHIGPVAQDFNGLFGYLFGEVESPVRINSMDAVGVSLAAAQGLD